MRRCAAMRACIHPGSSSSLDSDLHKTSLASPGRAQHQTITRECLERFFNAYSDRFAACRECFQLERLSAALCIAEEPEQMRARLQRWIRIKEFHPLCKFQLIQLEMLCCGTFWSPITNAEVLWGSCCRPGMSTWGTAGGQSASGAHIQAKIHYAGLPREHRKPFGEAP
eukprot:1147131-Pelagomonas_calceolata.AAC.2